MFEEGGLQRFLCGYPDAQSPIDDAMHLLRPTNDKLPHDELLNNSNVREEKESSCLERSSTSVSKRQHKELPSRFTLYDSNGSELRRSCH